MSIFDGKNYYKDSDSLYFWDYEAADLKLYVGGGKWKETTLEWVNPFTDFVKLSEEEAELEMTAIDAAFKKE